jgi:hypothetical protein
MTKKVSVMALLVLGIIVFLHGQGLAAISTTDLNTLTAQQLVQALVGSGVTVSNVTYTGANGASGSFTGGTSAGIGIDSGVILTNGAASNASLQNSGSKIDTQNGLPGDAGLTALAGDPTFDASILEFDFVTNFSSVSFKYIFASDEYPQFVGEFNDVFAFYIDGVNVALIPGTTTPVSINTVNDAVHSQYFVINYPNGSGISTFQNFPYDGFTKVFTAMANVTPGVTHHVKLAIADTADEALDSAVFIQAGSFSGGTPVPAAKSVPTMSEWGIIAFMIVAGLGAAYHLRRQTKLS